ncbi:peptidoglycan-binding protein [Candidatus Kaiserbacteria bacterium]|nr:peptidoglycan-binding protein [Candidatus Kaiserbacteria bacterium]
MNKLYKNTLATSLMALVLLTGTFVPQAKAQSISVLQAQIAELMATVIKLQAEIAKNNTSTNSTGYTWTRTLNIGATGEDVKKLQQFLNSSPDTSVALSGVGSAGFETTYYGPATANAVSKFQTKYRSEILSPAGLVNPTGFFGPSTMTKANALNKGSVVTKPTDPKPSTPTGSGTTKPNQLKGDGELNKFEIDNADEKDVKENVADAVVAELKLEAEDGDIEISRMDFALVADNSNTEKDPWDTFETISLWVNGEKIDEKSIDAKSDYLNKNLGTVRFANLNLILEEDEEMEMQVAVTVQNSVKGAGGNANWTISTERIRYFDADGVATDDNTTGDLTDDVTFSIVKRGDGEELKFVKSSDDGEDTHIVVNTSKKTTGETILEYTIEAIDSDITLDKLYVNVLTANKSYSDVVAGTKLVLGSQTFKQDSVLTTGNYSATNTRVAFDLDSKIKIKEGDKQTVKVVVDLKSQTAYANGQTIQAKITSLERDATKAEGADDINEFSGTVIGEEYTLISTGIMSSPQNVKFTSKTQGQNNTTGIFKVEFEITAVENDFYITDFATDSATTSLGGVRFSVQTSAGAPDNTSASLASNAKEVSNGVFVIREGETKKFDLSIVVDASAAGQHRVFLDKILFSTNPDGVTGIQTYIPTPTNNFRSPYEFINN